MNHSRAPARMQQYKACPIKPKPHRAHLFRLQVRSLPLVQEVTCTKPATDMQSLGSGSPKPKEERGLNLRDARGERSCFPPGREGGPKSLKRSNNGLGVRDTGIAHTFFACKFEVSLWCKKSPVQSQPPTCKAWVREVLNRKRNGA